MKPAPSSAHDETFFDAGSSPDRIQRRIRGWLIMPSSTLTHGKPWPDRATSRLVFPAPCPRRAPSAAAARGKLVCRPVNPQASWLCMGALATSVDRGCPGHKHGDPLVDNDSPVAAWRSIRALPRQSPIRGILTRIVPGSQA